MTLRDHLSPLYTRLKKAADRNASKVLTVRDAVELLEGLFDWFDRPSVLDPLLVPNPHTDELTPREDSLSFEETQELSRDDLLEGQPPQRTFPFAQEDVDRATSNDPMVYFKPARPARPDFDVEHPQKSDE